MTGVTLICTGSRSPIAAMHKAQGVLPLSSGGHAQAPAEPQWT